MVWPVVGAIAGGVLGLIGNRRTNRANRNLAQDTSAFNAREAAKDRAFNALEAHKARAYNTAERHKAQNFARDQAHRDRNAAEAAQLRAEARTRQYLDEDRAYADPAAVRARLEAAGYNPATGTDVSAGMMGAPAVAPGLLSTVGPGAATAAVAQSSGPAMGVTPQFSSPDYSFVSDAFTAYGNHLQAQQEFALRQSQVELENARLAQVMENAAARPVVGGLYSHQQSAQADIQSLRQGVARAAATASAPSPGSPAVGGVRAIGSSNAAPDTYSFETEAPAPKKGIYVSGERVINHPGWSPAEDIEAEMGEGEFLSPGWFYNWAKTFTDFGHHYGTQVSDWANSRKAKADREKYEKRKEKRPPTARGGPVAVPSYGPGGLFEIEPLVTYY